MRILRYWPCLLLLGAALLLAGCSGGRAATTSTAGAVRVRIAWPALTSRVIPVMTRSLRLTVYPWSGGGFIERVIDRPAGETSTTVVIDDIPAGTANFSVSAYPEPGGAGTALAFSQVTETIEAGRYVDITIALDSTIDHLAFYPPAVVLQPGGVQPLVLTAETAGGAVVPLSPSTLRWSSSDPAVATVTENGVVTAGTPGLATITVVETESNVTGTVLVTVSAAPGTIACSARAGDGTIEEIYTLWPDGSHLQRLASTPPRASNREPNISRDGSRIVFTSISPLPGSTVWNTDIYAMNIDGTGQQRLTTDPAEDAEPAYSPDGKKIAFTARRDGNREIYLMNADGSNQINL